MTTTVADPDQVIHDVQELATGLDRMTDLADTGMALMYLRQVRRRACSCDTGTTDGNQFLH